MGPELIDPECRNRLQVRSPFEIVSANLSDLISLPDQECAPALNTRLLALDKIREVLERSEQICERSYSDVGIIALEFQRRKLWQYQTDPKTGKPFKGFSAWAESTPMACRRTIFESKKDIKLLADIPVVGLIGVPKHNIEVLKELSTEVRNRSDILEAAKHMKSEALEEKIEREHPHQHIEPRAPYTIRPTRNERKDITWWVDYAIKNGLANNASEAIARACQVAKHDAELDEELKTMPIPEARA